MAEFKVEVVRVGPVTKHPNADTLSLTEVFAYPVVIRTGELAEGDRAVYLPVDAVVPEGDPRFAFLGEHRRIKAKRLRGIFSMGLLVRADPAWEVGQDVAALLGVVKYEPPPRLVMGGDNEPCPFAFPKYTEIENYRRYPDVLREGEEIVVTEKLHGTNSRFAFHEGRLWCGSHSGIKKRDPSVVWWKVAEAIGLEERLKAAPGVALYGEVYGDVQDLKYGLGRGELRLALFDALELSTLRYLGWDRTVEVARAVDLPTVPVLHRGPWGRDLLALANGSSMLAAHLREGVVVRAVAERFEPDTDRPMVKVIGEDYLLRKGGTEYH